MDKSSLREPAITVRGGIFLIGFGAAIGFSVGTAIGARRLRRDLEELEELHADTRTRVFALDTVDEAESIVAGTKVGRAAKAREDEIRRLTCRQCGASPDYALHDLSLTPLLQGSHAFVGLGDPIFPDVARDGNESPGTETP